LSATFDGNPEEKIRIVLDGLRGETSSFADREGIAESMYYS
jgi:hypothetical protein